MASILIHGTSESVASLLCTVVCAGGRMGSTTIATEVCAEGRMGVATSILGACLCVGGRVGVAVSVFAFSGGGIRGSRVTYGSN